MTLSALPATCHDFTGWSAATGCGSGSSCAVVVDGNKTVGATFTLIQNNVKATWNGIEGATGTVAVNGTPCNPSCDLVVGCGTTVTLTAVPGGAGTTAANRFGFVGWTNAGSCAAAATCSYTSLGDLAVTAVFSPFNYAFYSAKATYTPNLGGLGGADTECKTMAQAALLPGAADYVAFASRRLRWMPPIGWWVRRAFLRAAGSASTASPSSTPWTTFRNRRVRQTPLTTEGGTIVSTELQVLTGSDSQG